MTGAVLLGAGPELEPTFDALNIAASKRDALVARYRPALALCVVQRLLNMHGFAAIYDTRVYRVGSRRPRIRGLSDLTSGAGELPPGAAAPAGPVAGAAVLAADTDAGATARASRFAQRGNASLPAMALGLYRILYFWPLPLSPAVAASLVYCRR